MATSRDNFTTIPVTFLPNDLNNYIQTSIKRINSLLHENSCLARFHTADRKLSFEFESPQYYAQAFEILNGHLQFHYSELQLSPVSPPPLPQSAEIQLDEATHSYATSHLEEINEMLRKHDDKVRIEEGGRANHIKIQGPDNDVISDAFYFLKSHLEKVHKQNVENQPELSPEQTELSPNQTEIYPSQPHHVSSDDNADIKSKKSFLPAALYDLSQSEIEDIFERNSVEFKREITSSNTVVLEYEGIAHIVDGIKEKLDTMLKTFDKIKVQPSTYGASSPEQAEADYVYQCDELSPPSQPDVIESNPHDKEVQPSNPSKIQDSITSLTDKRKQGSEILQDQSFDRNKSMEEPLISPLLDTTSPSGDNIAMLKQTSVQLQTDPIQPNNTQQKPRKEKKDNALSNALKRNQNVAQTPTSTSPPSPPQVRNVPPQDASLRQSITPPTAPNSTDNKSSHAASPVSQDSSPRHISTSSFNHPQLVDDVMPASHEASSQPESTDKKPHITTPTSCEEAPFSHQTLETIIQFHDKYACVVKLPQGGRYKDAQYLEQLNLKVVQCPSQRSVLTLIADNKELIKCALKKLSEKFGMLGYLPPCNGIPIMKEALTSFVKVDETLRQQSNKHKVLASLTCGSGIKIMIKHMKIDDGQWDAVLKSVDSNSICSTRLDNMTITDAFGPNIVEKDSRSIARTADKLENWHFYVVKSQKIKYCKKLICLVVPGWSPTYFKGSHFKQSLTSVLEFCNKASMNSIAFPVIGHESKKIPIPLSAQALLQGIDEFSANIKSPNLRNIDIVISRDTQIRSFLYHFVTPIQNQINQPKYGKKLAGAESVEEEEDRCSICLDSLSSDVDPIRQLTKCKHEFHESCIIRAIEVNPMCPLCKAPLGIQLGNQPPRGTMSYAVGFNSLPGYPGVGSITIKYQVPGGIQDESHPNPGVSYAPTSRTAYLPDNDKGRKVLGLLQLGFDRGLIFTVGTSRTLGIDNVITWNDIHHKTSTSGTHGYPDEKYLDRVLAELKDKGVQ